MKYCLVNSKLFCLNNIYVVKPLFFQFIQLFFAPKSSFGGFPPGPTRGWEFGLAPPGLAFGLIPPGPRIGVALGPLDIIVRP